MYVEKLTLKNYRGIRDLTINFDRRLNVFVGDNGCGKTTILDAVKFCLLGKYSEVDGQIFNHPIPSQDVYIGARGALLEMQLDQDGERIFNKINSEAQETVKADFFVDRSRLAATFFEANRNSATTTTKLVDDLKKKNWIVSVNDWFNKDFNNYGIALAWIQEQENIENAAFRDHVENDEPLEAFKPNSSLMAVKNAIKDITGFKKFSFSASDNNFSFTKQVGSSKQRLQFNQLSLGERAFVGLVATIAFHIASYSEGIKNPFDAEQIIVIDEIDLHLHPKWQRKVIPALLKNFPKCQFIITTHSPQVIGEVRAKHVRVLKRNDEGDIVCVQPERSRGLSSSDILTEVMSGEAVTKDLLEEISKINSLIESEDYLKAKKLLAKAFNEYGEVPELIGVRSYLELFELEVGDA